MNNIMGIYQITNMVNNKFYIGSSIDIPKRWKQHTSDLKKNKHTNKHLQFAWNKYTEKNFNFQILELVLDEDSLKLIEQKWINKTKCFDGNIGYNISVEANRPNIGYVESHMNCNLVFRDKIEKLRNMKLNSNEKLVFYVLRDYIQYPTNCVVINDNIPSVKELEPLIGLTERSIISVLKSLEEFNLIKRVQHVHKKAIYINPEYYATGKDLETETLKLFGLLECDNEKINSYL